MRMSEVDLDDFVGTKKPTPKGGELTVLPWAGDRRGSHKYYPVTCSICSKDKELFPSPFMCKKSDIVKGIIPCGCGNRRWTKEQYETILSRKFLERGLPLKVVGWVDDGKKINCYSKPIIYCELHKITSCDSHVTHLRTGEVIGCTECRQDSYITHYCKPEAEASVDVTRYLESVGGEFLSFVGKYHGLSTKVKWKCKNGHYPETLLGSLVKLKNDCYLCKSNGFRDHKVGYFYLTEFYSEYDCLIKYGITNKDPKKRNSMQASYSPEFKTVKPVGYLKFEYGGDARYLEKEMMETYSKRSVGKHVFPDGYTETISFDGWTRYDILGDIIHMTGYDIFNGGWCLVEGEQPSLRFKGTYRWVSPSEDYV